MPSLSSLVYLDWPWHPVVPHWNRTEGAAIDDLADGCCSVREELVLTVRCQWMPYAQIDAMRDDEFQLLEAVPKAQSDALRAEATPVMGR